jgi:hypothetical protein
MPERGGDAPGLGIPVPEVSDLQIFAANGDPQLSGNSFSKETEQAAWVVW